MNNGDAIYRGLYYLSATSVNLAATTLICLRLWRTKRQMDKVGLSEMRVVEPVPYVRLTVVLLESALPFTVVGVSTAVLAFVVTDAASSALIFSSRLWTVASVSAVFQPLCSGSPCSSLGSYRASYSLPCRQRCIMDVKS
jgi:hypothetical protein